MKRFRCTWHADGTRSWPPDMPADLRATAEAVYAAERGKISRWFTAPEHAQLRVDYPGAGLVYTEARSRRDFGDSPTGGTVDVAAALKSVKAAMKVHSLLLPDSADRVGQIGIHLKNALKVLGGTLTDGGGLTNDNAGDDKTQLPSRSYSWMSPELQRFYKRQDLLQRMDKAQEAFEAMLLRTAPNSNAARMLKNDRQLAEIALDQARDDARTEKDNHHRRWESKDPYLSRPPWRSLELYKKPKEKERAKDPWVAS